jgi:hypothetical protein
MITRGSKFYFGAGIFGVLAALLYGFLTGAADHGGVVTVFREGSVVDSLVGPLSLGWKGWIGEHVGYTVLLGFGAVMFALGGFTTAFRDADAEALAQIDGIDVGDLPPAAAPWGLSYWPLLAAVSAGLVVVGLAFSQLFFYLGLVGLLVAGFEWTVRSWSEQATGDPELNAEYRSRLIGPLETAVGAVLVIAVVGLAVSRILLALGGVAAVFVIIGLAALVFGLANLLARRPESLRSVLLGVLVVGGLVLIVAGIVAEVVGPSDEEGRAGTVPVSVVEPS